MKKVCIFVFLCILLFTASYAQSVRPFIPNTVTFCGETVPLDRFDVRERLEYALLREMDRWKIPLIFKRIGLWFPMFEQKLKTAILPKDLEYIAVIESDLDSIALSNKGALGLWQFIRSTGSSYGLDRTSYIDERLDPIKSTEAAIKYFKDLYQEFGNWPEALTCYNFGMTRYKKAKADQNATDFYDVDLRNIAREAHEYFFRAIAIKLIMEHPEMYGFPTLSQINKTKYKPYNIKEFTLIVKNKENIVDIAKRLGMTYYEFRTFNLHVLKDHLPVGQYRIYVKKRIP